MSSLVNPDLLEPGPIRQFRFDFTFRCNLRCVYCAVSQPGYNGFDMPEEIRAKAIAGLREIADRSRLECVDLNGHGETTLIEGWTRAVEPLIEARLPVGLTTNLAKEYSREEIRVLSQIGTIAVSIDTSDRSLLRRMRRRVDVRQIVNNINLIRAAALEQPPHIHFLSGLYDKSSLLLEEFARFAVALRVELISFWPLMRYDYDAAQIPQEDRPTPLHELDDDQLRQCLESVARGFRVLREHGVGINVHADFVSRLAARMGMDV